ncbi:MAG TPA: PilN domain-containing protein [Acidobacteriaceae bacterium]|nr:PilN domain-containing protein [Acidobacteriaceae bacterium]
MNITLNLASRPYVDVRSTLRRLRALMVILVLAAAGLFVLLHFEQKKAHAATTKVNAVRDRVRGLEAQQRGYQALMNQPPNAAVLARADYLNGLFRRKAFSWTATMTDLETVLPQGVQVLSLDPAVTKSGQVQIRLRVSGARDRAIDLVQNLEKSRHFANTRLVNEAQAQGSGQNNGVQPVSASTIVNFDILADYRPVTQSEQSAEAHPKPTTKNGLSPARKRGRR